MELKGFYELDSNNIIGFYVEDHINKEKFLQLIKDNLEDYLDEDEIDNINILALDKVEHIWYREVSNTEDLEFDDYYSDHYFIFSNKERSNYFPMTKYEF